MKVDAVQIPVNDLMYVVYIGMEKSVQSFEPFLIDLKKGFKMILYALVIIGILRVPCMVNGSGRS